MTDLKTRARILVLVILAALPALLFTVYSAIARRASEERQARAELRRLVKLAAMQQWRVVEGRPADDGRLLAEPFDFARGQEALHPVFCESPRPEPGDVPFDGPVSGKRRATLQRGHLAGQGLWRRPAVLQARQGNGAIRDR